MTQLPATDRAGAKGTGFLACEARAAAVWCEHHLQIAAAHEEIRRGNRHEIMETNDSVASTFDIEEIRNRTQEYVREEPVKSVGIALIAGIFLTVFPVFSIVFGLVRLALALLRPALLVMGGIKIYEEYQKRYGA